MQSYGLHTSYQQFPDLIENLFQQAQVIGNNLSSALHLLTKVELLSERRPERLRQSDLDRIVSLTRDRRHSLNEAL